MEIIVALGLSAVLGVALTAGACQLILGVMPRRDP